MKKRYWAISLAALMMSSAALNGCASTPTPQPRTHQVSAWLPGDVGEAGHASFQANLKTLDEINFFWYVLTGEGTINALPGAEDDRLIRTARQAKLRIVPTVMNSFDPNRVDAVIGDPARRAAHVQDLVNLVLQNNYDGLEIDYEGLHADARDSFSAFIEELAAALRQQKRILAIAVHPKTDPEGGWDGARSQDWVRLGRAVDEFKVMTYDYHWSTSTAGPISPPEWIDQVLSLAEQLVSPDKVWMGMPFYGYVWQENNGLGLTWKEMERRARLYNVQPTRDEASAEMTFSYTTAQGEVFTAYYNDATSISTKLDVLIEKHPHIAGVCIWRLGDEDPAIWAEIQNRLKTAR